MGSEAKDGTKRRQIQRTRIKRLESAMQGDGRPQRILIDDVREVRRLWFEEHLDAKMIRLRLASNQRCTPTQRSEEWIRAVIQNNLHAWAQ